MNDLKYSELEAKHQELIAIAINYMSNIKDFEHNLNHMKDVVSYTKQLLNDLDIELDYEVCIISAYWHDVGRIKAFDGHEKISADMLKEEMKKLNYNEKLIKKSYEAIENHKWNMTPQTNEGLVVKDADKLAWIGLGRWKACLNNHQKLESIIELLPELRNNILYFEESKKIYDRDIIELVKLLYEYKNVM